MVEAGLLREGARRPPRLSIACAMTCDFMTTARWDRVPGRDRAKWTLRHPCHPNGLYGPLGRTCLATTPAPHFPPWGTNRNYRLVTKSVPWTSVEEELFRNATKRPFRFFTTYPPSAAQLAREGGEVRRRDTTRARPRPEAPHRATAHGALEAEGRSAQETRGLMGRRGSRDGGLRPGRSVSGPAPPQRLQRAPTTGNGDPRRESPSQRLSALFLGGAKGSRTPDLRYAKPALCQLSYGPMNPGTSPGHSGEHTFIGGRSRSPGRGPTRGATVRNWEQHKAVGRTSGLSAHPRLRVTHERAGTARAPVPGSPCGSPTAASDGQEVRRSALAGRRGLGPQVELGAVRLDLAVDGESPEGHQRQNDDLLHCLDPFVNPVRQRGLPSGTGAPQRTL